MKIKAILLIIIIFYSFSLFAKSVRHYSNSVEVQLNTSTGLDLLVHSFGIGFGFTTGVLTSYSLFHSPSLFKQTENEPSPPSIAAEMKHL